MSIALWAVVVVVGVLCLTVWVVLIAMARAAARGDAQIDREDERANWRRRMAEREDLPAVARSNRFARRPRSQRSGRLRSTSPDVSSEDSSSSEHENGSSVVR